MSTLGFTNVFNIGGFNSNPGIRNCFPTSGVPNTELEDAREALRNLINKINDKGLVESNYTASSWAELRDALANGVGALDSDDIEVIRAAYARLRAACNALTEVSPGDQTPPPAPPAAPTPPQQNLPATGQAASFTATILGGLMLTLSAVIMVKKKNKLIKLQ